MKSNLDNHVLILNKNWTVIGVIVVKDAITLMSKGSAKGVCTQTFTTYSWENWISNENPPKVDFYIQSPSMQIPAPQVIVLIKYDDVYHTSIRFSQRAIYNRDQYTCQYCEKKLTTKELSIDHVIPRSKKGKNNFENCVTSCKPCNNRKANLEPNEAGMALIKKPVKPIYNPVYHIKERPKAWKPLLKENW